MSKKKAYWEGVFNRYNSSGLTQLEFCKENNLSHNQFQYRWYERNKVLKAQSLSVEGFETISVTSNRAPSTVMSVIIHLPNKIECHVAMSSNDLASLLAQVVQPC